MQADAVAAALAQAHRSEWTRGLVRHGARRVALWEGVMRVWAQVFRRTPPTPVDATKLVPLTVVVVIALIAMGECSSSPTSSTRSLSPKKVSESCRRRACPFAVGMKRFH
jgi:hypothetical protein